MTKDVQEAYVAVSRLFEESTNSETDTQLLYHHGLSILFEIFARFCIAAPEELLKQLLLAFDPNAPRNIFTINSLLGKVMHWLQQLHQRLVSRLEEVAMLRAPELRPHESAQGSLFALPQSIMFHGSFPAAVREATTTGRWLLVSIYDDSFASFELYRDTWANDVVQTLITVDYIFWTVDAKSVEGELFCQAYHCISYPFIAIIDPLTMTIVKNWSSLSVTRASDELQHFLDSHTIVTPVSTAQVTVESPKGTDLSESERFEIAITRSLQDNRQEEPSHVENRVRALEVDFIGVIDQYTTSREPDDLVTFQLQVPNRDRTHPVTVCKTTPTLILYAIARKILATEFEHKDYVNVPPFILTTHTNTVLFKGSALHFYVKI